MARKQDTREKAPKSAAKGKSKDEKPKRAKAASVTAPVPAAAKAVAARVTRGRKAAVEAVRKPVVASSTKVKDKAKKALKSAKTQARGLMPDLRAPALPDVPSQIGDTFKSIGTQIAGALNTDVGRVMVAELLIYVAKTLTKAAANTEVAEDAKSALLNAGAKIGAAAADAGAKMVETGHSAADAGAKLLDEGRAAATSGAEAAGEAAGTATDIVREMAQVAVGAVGGVVTDVAKKAIAGRGRKPAAAGAPKAPKPAGEETAPEPAGEAGSGTAPAFAADAGHHPRQL